MPATKTEIRNYTKKVDSILKSFDRVEASTVKKTNALLVDLKGNLQAQFAALGPDPSSFDQLRLSTALDSTDRLIDDYGAKQNRVLTDALGNSWDHGERLVHEPLDTVGLGDGWFRPSRNQVQVLSQFTTDLVQNVTQGMKTDIARQVRLTGLGAVSPFQAGKEVTRLIGAPARKSDRATGYSYQAERIVRTETNRAFSIANQSTQNQAAGKIDGLLKQWLAAADGRTRENHLNAHGQRVPIDKKFKIGKHKLMMPHDPAGPASETINCRCRTITIPPEFADELANTPRDEAIEKEKAKRAGTATDKTTKKVQAARKPQTAEEARKALIALDKEHNANKSALTKSVKSAKVDSNNTYWDWDKDKKNPAKRDAKFAAKKRQTVLQKDLNDLNKKHKENLRSILEVDDPIEVQLTQVGKKGKIPKKWQDGVDSFSKLVDKKAVSDRGFLGGDPEGAIKIGVNKLPARERAYHQHGIIHLAPSDGQAVVVHELGHALDRRNEISKVHNVNNLSRRFRNNRTRGERAITMNEATGNRGYDSDEITKKDKFMHPYMGKIYRGNASEITSMGLEYMYSKPVAFAKKDPEMFDFIYNVARGNS